MDATPQVQVVENRSEVSGRVTRIEHETAHGRRDAIVTLEVEIVTAEPGYRNLFEWAVGRPIDVRVPAATAEQLKVAVGQQVSWIVRRAVPGPATFVRGSTGPMTAPVENKADISATVKTLAPNARMSGYVVATLDVAAAADVAGYPNLFGWAAGKSIEVNVPAAFVAANNVAAGQKVTWRVKKTGPSAAILLQEP